VIRAARLLATAATVLLLAGCVPVGAGPSAGPSAIASASPHPSASPAEPRPPLADLDLVPDPKHYEGPSTATLAQEAIIPIEEHPVQRLPTTVVSHDAGGDVEVTVTDTSRVVAIDLAGSVAATVWGLGFGDTLVGRDLSTTFPGTEGLPVVTSGGHSVNAESILALRPTLVVTDGTIGPRDVLEQLRDAGVPVVFVKNEPSFEGAQELVRQVAAVFGAPAAGDALADRIARQVDDEIAQIAAIAPERAADRLRMIFLYLRGNAGVYYLFGEESGADDLIDALGGIDVAGEIGWTGMRPMTDEALIAADPDLILVMTDGLASVGGVDGLLESKPAIALTAAGQHRRFVDMADGDILSFGPRSAEVLDALARAIYAPGG